MASTIAPATAKPSRSKLPADGKSSVTVALERAMFSQGAVTLRLCESKAPLVLDAIAVLIVPAIMLLKALLHRPATYAQVWVFLPLAALVLAIAWRRAQRGTAGSFSPSGPQRRITVALGEAAPAVEVFAARHPGLACLCGPGVRHRIEYVPASLRDSAVYDLLPTLLYAVFFALVLRSFIVASFYIPSGSMENTLYQGDLLVAEKLSIKVLGRDPQRGDVVIFLWPPGLIEDPPERTDFVKRLIGLPGETVEVRNETVYVDGRPLDEPYIKEAPLEDYAPRKVPQGCFFMMGDNRNRSRDSREWGFVPREDLEGKALFIFWPPRRAGLIR
jgi:signal peptidase I